MDMQKISLTNRILLTFVVVVFDVVGDHVDDIFTAGESTLVIALSFEYSPKSFHRAIVNAFPDSGHTLSHIMIL